MMAFRRWLGSRENTLLLSLAVFVLVVAYFAPRFVLRENLALILLAAAPLGIVAIAETIVILSGGIDISVGAILAISASLIGATIQAGMPAPLSIALGLVAGAFLGLINGSLVAFLRLPPIIVTLATLFIFRGGIDVVMEGTTFPQPTEQLSLLVSGSVGGVHMQVIVVLITAMAAALFLGHTRWGRMIYAVGDNASAAEISGVKLTRVRLLVYVASGFLSAIAGLVHATRSPIINRTAGFGVEFIAIGAVVVGGTNLFGGSGTIRGTVTGVVLIYAIHNAMVIAHIPTEWQDAATGGLILVAVGVNVLWRRTANDDG